MTLADTMFAYLVLHVKNGRINSFAYIKIHFPLLLSYNYVIYICARCSSFFYRDFGFFTVLFSHILHPSALYFVDGVSFIHIIIVYVFDSKDFLFMLTVENYLL